ncbi:MAG TPA: hypothetical protein VK564_06355 [Thermodesulfobacteriota bacterium]|nr:hypothetical protein [Thermodesulfobacteriota bacterium]
MSNQDKEPSEGKNDYFFAEMEDGELVMRPFCQCGNPLAEDYTCEKCQRQCLCTDVICADETTFRFIQDHPPFKRFKIYQASK